MALRVRGRAWIWGKRPRERKREKEKEICCFSPSKLHFILFKFDTLLCSQNEVFKQVWTNSSLTLTLTLFLCPNSLPLLMTLSALSRSTLYTLHSPCWILLIFLLSLLALTRNIERKERDSKQFNWVLGIGLGEIETKMSRNWEWDLLLLLFSCFLFITWENSALFVFPLSN